MKIKWQIQIGVKTWVVQMELLRRIYRIHIINNYSWRLQNVIQSESPAGTLQ